MRVKTGNHAKGKSVDMPSNNQTGVSPFNDAGESPSTNVGGPSP